MTNFQLQNIKDPKTKVTVLDFIVSNVEENFHDLKNFYSEIEHVDKASRIDFEHIRKCLLEINSELCLVRQELDSNSNAYNAVKEDR